MRGRIYIAHKDDKGRIQTIKEHSENTASLCEEYAIDELKSYAYIIGLLHDIGKYTDSFKERIGGKNIRVEHSIYGAHEIGKLFADKFDKLFRLVAQYCIAGHHSGIPNGGGLNDTAKDSTLHGRLNRQYEDYSKYKSDLTLPKVDTTTFTKYILEGCGDKNIDMLYDKFHGWKLTS